MKRIHYLLFAVMLVAAVSLPMTSCKDDEPEIEAVEARITLGSDEPVNFTYEAGQQQFSFNTNMAWTILPDEEADWLEITPLQGEAGDVTLTLSVEANDDDAEREASFTIAAGEAEATVSVTQSAAGDEPEQPEEQLEFDPDFEAYLVKNFDTDGDGKLSKAEAEAIIEITCPTEEATLTSLKGIKNLTGLQKLNISYNSVTDSLDLSGMTSLKEVACDHNLIRHIKVNGCTALETLKANDMTGYILESVDLTGCQALKSLNIVDGAVTKLDLKDCVALQDINIAYNSIPSLDFSNNNELVNVTTRNNPMSGFTLDLSGKSKMVYLNCTTSQLGGLVLSGCSALTQLAMRSVALSGSPLSSWKTRLATPLSFTRRPPTIASRLSSDAFAPVMISSLVS